MFSLCSNRGKLVPPGRIMSGQRARVRVSAATWLRTIRTPRARVRAEWSINLFSACFYIGHDARPSFSVVPARLPVTVPPGS